MLGKENAVQFLTVKTAIRWAFLAVGALGLGACSTGSYTYGTGVSQEQQLVDDLTSIFTPKKRQRIDYRERPNIVKPKTTVVLANPITDLEASNPAWPESPEQRLIRLREQRNSTDPALRAEAKRQLLEFDQTKRDSFDARQRARLDNLNIQKETADLTPEERRAFIRRYRQNNPNNITGTRRRYLSEPPTEYRQPAQSAAYGDLGLTERQKRECLRTKGRSGLFGSLRNRGGKKKLCAEYLASLNLVDQKKSQSAN